MDRIKPGSVFIPLVVIGLPLLSTEIAMDPGLHIRFLGLAVLLTILSVYLLFRKQDPKPVWNPILIVYSLFIIYLVFRISGIYVVSDSWFAWLKAALFFVLFLVSCNVYGFNTIRHSLTWSLSLLGVIITIWGIYELLLQVADNHLEVPTDTYYVKACFEHRNLFAQILLMTFAFQLSQAITSGKKWLSFIFIVSASLNLFLIITLSNRAVWLATAVSLVVFVLLFWLFAKRNQSPSSGNLKRGLIKLFVVVSTALVLSSVFYQVYALKGKLIGHATSVGDTRAGSGEDRIELWHRTIKLIAEKPITGHGLANWKIEILKFGNKNLLSEDNLTFYQRPHNDFLWIASETGVVGLALYLLIFLMTIVVGVKLLRQEKEWVNQVYLIIVLTVLTGYLTFSFFSFPLERIVQNTFITLLISSIFIRRSEVPGLSSTVGKSFNKAIWVFAILIGGAAIITGIFRLKGETGLKKAMLSRDRKDYTQLLSDIDEASGLLYKMDPTSTPLSWYSGFAYFQMSDFDEAIVQFQTAFVQNPYHIHVLNNLGSSYFKVGKADSAVLYYQRALEIAPNFEESRLNLSAVLYNKGENDRAYEVFSAIDSTSDDPRYGIFLKAILQSKIKSMFPEDSIPVLPEDYGWYYKLHKKAIEDSTSIEKLIFETELFTPNE